MPSTIVEREQATLDVLKAQRDGFLREATHQPRSINSLRNVALAVLMQARITQQQHALDHLI